MSLDRYFKKLDRDKYGVRTVNENLFGMDYVKETLITPLSKV